MTGKKRLPDSELTVMLAIWKSGAEKIHTGEILELLRKSGYTAWKTQTVQNMLIRLTEKNYLICEKLGRLNFYTPLVSIREYQEMETNTLLERFYGGSAKSLFAALAEKTTLSPEEAEEIRRLLFREAGK
ncbi:MAG: BlaI/MecI/CopY family transcriptional regulator [Oscillospiraceae bacterium]|jgi:predicted transcriptional regulator|nr:BlaI/MecI/CopY family transcriptional regulator [Oscillospiraceae bacterium]